MAETDEKRAPKSAYVLTDEQLKTLIAEVKAGGAQPNFGGRPMSPDEQVNLFRDQIKGDIVSRPPHKLEEVRCTSVKTGAKFTAVIVTSKSYPAGRVIDLKDYEYPAGADLHKVEGGLVPDGMMIKHPNSGEPGRDYKQWKWLNFWKADLETYVGSDAAWLRRMADVETTAPSATGGT